LIRDCINRHQAQKHPDQFDIHEVLTALGGVVSEFSASIINLHGPGVDPIAKVADIARRKLMLDDVKEASPAHLAVPEGQVLH
jgi:hypothetical protein